MKKQKLFIFYIKNKNTKLFIFYIKEKIKKNIYFLTLLFYTEPILDIFFFDTL